MKRIFYKIIPKKNWQIEYADGESILIMLKICLPRIWPSSTLSKSIIRDSNDKCWKLSLSFTIFRNSWPRVKIKSFSESLVHKSWWIILIHLAWFFVFSVRFSCPTWSTSSCMFFFPSLAFYLSFFFSPLMFSTDCQVFSTSVFSWHGQRVLNVFLFMTLITFLLFCSLSYDLLYFSGNVASLIHKSHLCFLLCVLPKTHK